MCTGLYLHYETLSQESLQADPVLIYNHVLNFTCTLAEVQTCSSKQTDNKTDCILQIYSMKMREKNGHVGVKN